MGRCMIFHCGVGLLVLQCQGEVTGYGVGLVS